MRAVLVGAVASTAVALQAFARSDWELALCVTLPSEKSERHSDFVDLAHDARMAGTDMFFTTATNDPATVEAIRAARPDFIFVIGWSQICGANFLDIVPGRVIGYHPAALPRLRGRAAIAWTILLDEKITAGSLFYMADGVDDGQILDQQYFHVAPRETASTLYAKHMAALEQMLDRTLVRLAKGEAKPEPQDDCCATYAVRRTSADGLIDWRQPARDIDRLVRAAGRPYPGAFTTAKDAKLTIWASEPVDPPLPYHAEPGQLVAHDNDGLLIQTGSGQLRVSEWSWELVGRPPMHGLLGRGHG
ncbi:methionyl-tRNA formyltransferase [Sphingopyxis sp.]|uniref:methionyl-tRNA formyltransferase n=1 Tax=Sphingopyxis sp. TaxID=1908224 RepID=UPI003D10E12F